MSTDDRTPGRVLYEKCRSEGRWERLALTSREEWEEVAAAVLAHHAAQQSARGEIVVPRADLRVLLRDATGFESRDGLGPWQRLADLIAESA